MNKKTTFLKSLRYICLAFVISFGFITIIATGGGGSDDGGTSYYLHPEKTLSTSPMFTDTGSWTSRFRSGSSSEWSIELTGDIVGGTYSYNIWAWAVGSSFRIDIILLQSGIETDLASWTGITTTDPDYYVQVQGTASGPAPTTETGDRLIVRITHTGPYTDWVEIKCSGELQSHITVGP